MPTDATGTPTSPDNIPTYNTAGNIPSGKGFNAAMAAIQVALTKRSSFSTSALSGGPPASPSDGDLWNATGVDSIGTRWQFQYNAASGSAYKWEFLGGSPAEHRLPAIESTTNNSFADLATTGPIVTLARPGDYRMQGNAQVGMNVAGDITLGLFLAGVFQMENRLTCAVATSNNAANGLMMLDHILSGVTAGQAAKLMYHSPVGTTTAYYAYRVLKATPIRIS